MDKVNVFVAAIIAGVLAFWVPLWMGRSDSGNFDRIPQVHVDMVASVAEWSPKRFQGYLESYVAYLVDRGRIVQANRFLHEHSKVILAGRGRGSKLNHPARWMDVESLNLLTARGGVTWTSRDLAEAMKHGNLYFLEHRVGTVLQDYSPKDAGRLMLDFAEIAYRDRLTNVCDRRDAFSRVMQDFVYVISVNEMKYLHYYSPKYGKAFTAPVLLYSLCKGRGNYHINDHIKEKDFFRVEKKLEEKGTFQFFFDPDFQRRWFEFEERMQLSKLETKAAREAKRKRKARGEDRLSKVRAAMGWCSNNDNETCRERRAAQARKATQPSGFDGRAYTACQNQKAQCMAQCEGFPDRDPRLGAIENALWGSSPRGKCRSKCYSISCY